MVPRAKTQAVAKPAKSQPERNTGQLDATAKSSTMTKNAPAKVGRPRGRPPAVNKVLKPAQKATRHGTPATELASKPGPLKGGNINTQNKLARPRARPKAASEDDEDEFAKDPNDENFGTKMPVLVEEIPETQFQDLMTTDEEPGHRLTSKSQRPAGNEDWLDEELVTDDMDAMSLRRKLDDLSKRYESLQVRHRDLREVGVRAAELNFQRLRKQTDENTKGTKRQCFSEASRTSNDLISRLREELAAQSKVLNQAEDLRHQLELSQAEANDLRATLAKASNELSESKSEVKAMSVKLATSRANEVHAKAATTSAKATGPAGNRAVQEMAQLATAKEDLYGDLTGLIVRGLKRGQKEDLFDCIQTGRNGSLHFKLAVEKVDGNDYEDAEVTYRPQLDANRDSEVIEMLPDYLREEIVFPRAQASKFYTRVTKALTERAD